MSATGMTEQIWPIARVSVQRALALTDPGSHADGEIAAVGIDHYAFMLSPLGVLGSHDFHAGRHPDAGQLIRVVDE